MSEIDGYRHVCIGIVVCPSTYEIVPGNNTHREIPLYRLEEDASDWEAKSGDLLLGGGAGESPALRISIPEAVVWATREGARNPLPPEGVCRAYWSMTRAYVFGEGYVQIGWHPSQPIESWLTENVVAFILREYPETYGPHRGPGPMKNDGSIFRKPAAGMAETDL